MIYKSSTQSLVGSLSLRAHVVAGWMDRRERPSVSSAQVNKQTLRDQVTHILRESILSGEFEPGQRLSEPELAKRLNVSLTPVREALGSLAATGLVVRSGRQGTHVRSLRSRDVENLIAVREALEVLAVRQSIPHLTPEDDARLQRILDDQAKATELAATNPTRAVPQLAQLNEDFHQLILQRTGNEWLVAMLASIQELLVFARARLRMNATLERRVQSLEEHRHIAAGLARRDPEAAVRRMSEHLDHLKQHVLALAPPAAGADQGSAHPDASGRSVVGRRSDRSEPDRSTPNGEKRRGSRVATKR